MAWIEHDKKSGTFRVRFRYPEPTGPKFRLSVRHKIKTSNEANQLADDVEEFISLVVRGRVEVPEGVEPGVFIAHLGKLPERALGPGTPRAKTLGELCQAYLDAMSRVEDRDSTLKTERIHVGHLSDKRLLGSSLEVASVTFGHVQRYVDQRRAQKNDKGKPIQRPTIEKELETLRVIWRWGLRTGHITARVPWEMKSLKLPPAAHKPPYRTIDEIERVLSRGGVDPGKEETLWETLYLKDEHIKEVLDLVQRGEGQPFVYPMFAFAALTGARRSELLRSVIDDFDFDNRKVQLRGKKGRRDTDLVVRHVDLHPRLEAAMRAWLLVHPGGRFSVCHPDGRPLTTDAANYHFGLALRGTRWSVIRGFHVFRHSLASVLASKGADQRVIDAYLGHQTAEMRQRYQHLFPPEAQTAIEALGVG
jgi:integrase